ncbi:hypothetical protein LUTEI9C_50252 [Luteimonas sp. 9C]|nr:hypothetical protein LUTEI9C_50252 [Luteimonas sp. 9C]
MSPRGVFNPAAMTVPRQARDQAMTRAAARVRGRRLCCHGTVMQLPSQCQQACAICAPSLTSA